MNEITYKDLKLNTDLKSCSISGEAVKLTKTEYNLLYFLLTNRNKVFSRKEILNNIDTRNVSLRTVDAVVSRVRKKFVDCSNYITTRMGFGYGIVD